MVYDSELWGDEIDLPLYVLAPEEIFKGKIGLFDVNFFEPDTTSTRMGTDKSLADQLKPTISNWYKTIRGIALISMLSVLVYIGIRILISSTADNKAKYKQLLVDWIIGLCMLFFMHYGMSFANMLVDKLTEAIAAVTDSGYVEMIEYKEVKDAIEKADPPIDVGEGDGHEVELVKADDGTEYIFWRTNLMGHMRVQSMYARSKNEGYWGYAICFLIIAFMLIFFIYTYLRRALYLAFLTLIAPFVALMYPLDKVKDGKAQSFDYWFKEYFWNLMLQPLHLLLYTILVSSAIELATENVIYSIVALGFMVPAEKIIRQLFGFKGNTPGSMPGAAGAALVMSGVKGLLNQAPHEEEPKIGNSSSNKSGKTRMQDVDYSIFGGDQENSQNGPSGGLPIPNPNPDPDPNSNPDPNVNPNPGPDPNINPNPDPDPNVNPNPGPDPNINPTPDPNVNPNPGPDPNINPTPDPNVNPNPGPDPNVNPNPSPAPNPTPISTGGNNGNQGGRDYSLKARAKERMKANAKKAGRAIQRRADFGMVGRQIGRNVTRRISNKAKKMRPTRFLAGVALGAAGAGIGIAAGAVSGDMSKVSSYASMGALAGNKAGRGFASVLGIEESVQAVNQANMTPEESQEKERNDILKSQEYQLQMDTEDRETKRLLNQRMEDGRTIREATLDKGYTHDEQVRMAKYAMADENKDRFSDLTKAPSRSDLTSDGYGRRVSSATALYNEVDNVKTLSENLGVTNFSQLDSSTRQSKMEHIAKNTDSAEYKRLKSQKEEQESVKEAATTSQEKIRAQNKINDLKEQMRSLPGAVSFANAIDSWGRTDKS